MTRVLWVPGRFSLTNQLLAEVRAAGFYAGRHMTKGMRVRASPGSNVFTTHQQAVRLAVKAAAARGAPIATGMTWDLTFYVFCHRKHDPSAWYLLGKAAEDGLVDAGVLGSDRFQVGTTSGRVLQSAAEELHFAQRFSSLLGSGGPIDGPGVAIILSPARCPHE